MWFYPPDGIDEVDVEAVVGILNGVDVSPAPVLCRAPPRPRIHTHGHGHTPALTLSRVLTRSLFLALAHLGMLTAFIFFCAVEF